MIIKNKRGIGLQWYLLIVAFVLGIVAYYVDFYFAPHKIMDNYIGQYQFSILMTHNKAEKALFYIDQSAKYALQQAVIDLAKNGGYSDKNDCGYYFGANLWSIQEENKALKECYPIYQELADNFKVFFDEKLTEYLVNYPDTLIPANYDYEIDGNVEMKGIAKEDIIINIVPANFVPKPPITSKNTNEIYEQSLNQPTPEILRAPVKPGIDIETIQEYHPEVIVQYTKLCNIMGATDKLGNPPGVCTKTEKKCCITSGYRHPSKNAEIPGAARNSAHQYGLALDIHVGSLNEQIRWAKQIEKSKLFTRAFVYPYDQHMHVDLMPLNGENAAGYLIIDKKGKTMASASNAAELESKANSIRTT